MLQSPGKGAHCSKKLRFQFFRYHCWYYVLLYKTLPDSIPALRINQPLPAYTTVTKITAISATTVTVTGDVRPQAMSIILMYDF